MAKPNQVEFADGTVIPILYEDRAVLALDKPAGWMLAPDSWNKTSRNLQLALERSLRAGDYWAKARGLRFIRFIHRLDAGTTGIVLFALSRGALAPYSRLFQSRRVVKRYLAVVHGVPRQSAWECALPLAPDRRRPGIMTINQQAGKAALTRFRLLQAGEGIALVQAWPVTGRTHQIRVHLAAAGHPVLGDELYKRLAPRSQATPQTPDKLRGALASELRGALAPPALALRAVFLSYPDPFTGRQVRIVAPGAPFAQQFGFAPESVEELAEPERQDS